MSQQNKATSGEEIRYRVVVIGADGDYLSDSDADTLREAKALARDRLLSDTEYLTTDAVKAEVHNARGECVFDVFAKVRA